MHTALGALAIGSVVGFFSGLLGKGGSAVTTPALRVFLNIPAYLALASPLPAALPTALSASLAYKGRDLVDWRAVQVTCAWGVPATVLGSWASQWVGGHILMLLTALFVSSLGLSLLNHSEAQGEARSSKAGSGGKLAAIAIGVGLLSGLLANTGGILYGPLFIQWVRMPTKRALATSLIVSAVLAVPGTLTHWYLGHIDWVLVLLLAAGTIPCSYLGARLAIYLKSETLVKIYGISLTLFGLYDLLFTEGPARAWLRF